MRGCRLYNYKNTKTLDEIEVGDVVIFSLDDQSKYDNDYDTSKSPTFSSVGVITAIRAREPYGVEFSCYEPFTGVEFTKKTNRFWPNSTNPRRLIIITPDEVEFEKRLGDVATPYTKLTFVSGPDLPTYIVRGIGWKVVKLPLGWVVMDNGEILGRVDSPSDIGYLENESGFLSGFRGENENFWFRNSA